MRKVLLIALCLGSSAFYGALNTAYAGCPEDPGCSLTVPSNQVQLQPSNDPNNYNRSNAGSINGQSANDGVIKAVHEQQKKATEEQQCKDPKNANNATCTPYIKAACAENVDKASSSSCSKSFSCEGLFQEHTKALTCNFKRCEAQGRSDCVCKYGDWSDNASAKGSGKGIPLNTSIPFIGKCVGATKEPYSPDASGNAALTAFPTIIQAASRILVTIILLSGFIMIVVGGVQWASGDAKSGMEKIKKVAMGFALLGFMGAILRLINPNFFK